MRPGKPGIKCFYVIQLIHKTGCHCGAHKTQVVVRGENGMVEMADTCPLEQFILIA